MDFNRIPFNAIPQFSQKDVAYAEANPALRPFYKYEVSMESFQQVIQDKQKDHTNRAVLQEVLTEQYQQLAASKAVAANIARLGEENCFTVTTAHQPSLCTGPLYFIYKILSTINLAERLSHNYTDYQFVPIFIVGGEDHDFEEINHTYLFNKKLVWENEEKGAVGQMQTKSLAPTLSTLKDVLGNSDKSIEIYQLIEGAYTQNEWYGPATVQLVDALFSEMGLVVLNPNHPKLKALFRPHIRKEIFEQPSQTLVETAAAALNDAGFSGQAHARAINFFYLRDQLRSRIVQEADQFKVLDTDYTFTAKEMEQEIENHPEYFSPNVIMRPIYQELILPNLAYIGGGGEIAYWLERKKQFEVFGLNFPMLIRRNSVLWIDRGSYKKMQKADLDVLALSGEIETLLKEYVREQSEESLQLTAEKKQIAQLFEQIKEKTVQVDPTLGKTVLAEQAKQIKSLEQLEGRLMKAAKQKHEVILNQIRNLKEKLFPGNGLQERHDNFLPFYLKYGRDFFRMLKEELDPLERGMVVVVDKPDA